MRLNMRLMGLLFGLLVIAMIGAHGPARSRRACAATARAACVIVVICVARSSC